MAHPPDIRSIFEDVSPSTIRRILGGQPARALPVEGGLYLWARNAGELIWVEPRIRPAGDLGLAYTLRDDELLAGVLDRLGLSRRGPAHGTRPAKGRRLSLIETSV